MRLEAKAASTPAVAVFSRNHREYLDAAVKADPERPITFRAQRVWRAARAAVETYGPRKIYFVPIPGNKLVEYQALLEKVVLYPAQLDADTVNQLLANCLEKTRDEGLWEQYGEVVRTLYVISHCQKLASPFPQTALRKLSDEEPIAENYVRAYVVCYEHEI